MKYKPQTREELQKLVQDENIYLGDIDTSLITDMSGLFSFERRKDFSGIGNWNVNKVTSMRGMFYNCYSFNEDIGKWNVNNVNNMGDLFYNCINFNQNISEYPEIITFTVMYHDYYSQRHFIKKEYKFKLVDYLKYDINYNRDFNCYDIKKSF